MCAYLQCSGSNLFCLVASSSDGGWTIPLLTPNKNRKQPATFASVVQVRDFEFSPDDGRIAGLVIDALGIPALPVKLLGCSSVKIQLVQNITWNCITLSPGSEAYIQKLTTGLFDNAVNVLRVSQLLSPHVTLFDMSHCLQCHIVCNVTLFDMSHSTSCVLCASEQILRYSKLHTRAASSLRIPNTVCLCK